MRDQNGVVARCIERAIGLIADRNVPDRRAAHGAEFGQFETLFCYNQFVSHSCSFPPPLE